MAYNRGLLLSGAAIAGFLALGGGAMAADIVEEPPPPEPTWTGFHIGVGAGYGSVLHDGFLEAEGDISESGTPTQEYENLLEFDDLGDQSWLAAVEIGFDFQVGENFVIGIFGDYTFADFDATADDLVCSDQNTVVDCVGKEINIETDNIWTVGGRIGFLTSPGTLWYGLAGYTNARVDVTGDLLVVDDECCDPLEAFNFLSDDDRVDGFTVGAGVESLLSDHFSIKLEYRYSDLDSFSKLYDGETIEFENGFGADVEEFETDFDTRIHSIRAVLSWRL